MMKIAWLHGVFADVQVAAEQIKILRAGMRMRGVTRAGSESAKCHHVAGGMVDRKQLDPGPRHRQGLPAARVSSRHEGEPDRFPALAWRGECRLGRARLV